MKKEGTSVFIHKIFSTPTLVIDNRASVGGGGYLYKYFGDGGEAIWVSMRDDLGEFSSSLSKENQLGVN
uniref:Uncharacterized protein n=1 Tax=Solanum lycopersicum TaxID=4081 RepID=K4C539_SOLLC